MSQLRLALRADVSARHVSFIESGGSVPGRDVLLRLGRALELPLREMNQLLDVAGYAPLHVFTAPLDAQELQLETFFPTDEASERLLRSLARSPAHGSGE